MLASGPAWKANAGGHLSEIEKLAYANVHDETMECLMYYEMSAIALQREPNADKEFIETLEQVNQILLLQIEALIIITGMKVEASMATMRLISRKMMQEINNDFVNFTILIEKYADLCKVVYENSDSRIRHWMNEAAKKP